MRFRKLKKTIGPIITSCLIMSSLAGCGVIDTTPIEPVDVLLITDVGTVEDGSFNQGAWEGIKRYGEEKDVLVGYYEPENTDKESYLKEVKKGVKNGAKLIICPGYLLEETVYEAAKDYPDVDFILLDGEPHNADYSDMTIANNVMPILFAEEQAGFLAGYAAVRDGYTGLGFMGGIPEDPVIRFGYGFVQGADYAAIERGVSVHIRYTYTNTFYEDNAVERMAETWYNDDTEAIFACGGAMGRSVMRAAEKCNKKVIGVDVDQRNESDTVITSAVKSLANAVYMSISDYYDGNFGGGFVKRYSAAEGGVSLPLESSRFNRFSQAEYDSIYQLLVDGTVVPYEKTNVGTTEELSLVNTVITYVGSEALEVTADE